MRFEDYKIVLYRQENGSWVAEIPAIGGCYALMKTREEALAELPLAELPYVFSMIENECREKGQKLPADSTEIVNA
jgi:predicted RNase H-like HicB family nuclease